MSFLAPGFLWLAALILGALVVAHLFSRSRPRETVLPTARFVPEGLAHAPTRARAPTDLLLLLVRAAMLALIGASFAEPWVRGARRDVGRVFAVDVSSHVSRDTAGRAALTESLRALYRENDLVVAFDTIVRAVASLDSVTGVAPSSAPGSLSAGLLGAIRAASQLAQRADSVEIVLVSPVHAGEIDSATLTIRATWPGRVRLVRTAGASNPARRSRPELVAMPDDPLRPALSFSDGMANVEVRVVRNGATGADSAWAAAGHRALVVWPAMRAGTPNAARGARDSIGSVIAGGRVLVAPLERHAAQPEGRIVARWIDGSAAATEAPHGAGCIRTVAIGVPATGDVVLRPEFVLFVRELLAPCGGHRELTPASDAITAALAGDGALAASRDIRDEGNADPRLAGWLLVSALVLGLLEHRLRRVARTGRVDDDVASPQRVAGAGA